MVEQAVLSQEEETWEDILPSYRVGETREGTLSVEHHYQPFKEQLEMHQDPHQFRWFVGGMGSGKTRWLCEEIVKLLFKYRKNRGIIVMQTMGRMEMTVVNVLEDEVLGPLEKSNPLIKHVVKSPVYKITLVNGSVLYLSSFDDVGKIKGQAWGVVGLEEASDLAPDVFNYFVTRLRWRIPAEARCIIITSNPNGEDWLYERFVYNPENVNPDLKKRFGYKQVFTDANPYIPGRKEYIKTWLESGLPQEFVERFFYASFTACSNRIYPLNKCAHILSSSFQTDPWWSRIMAADYGSAAPFAITNSCVDERDNIIVFDEFYEGGRTIQHIAYEIRAMYERDRKDLNDRVPEMRRIIDPSTIRKESDGLSVVDRFRQNGIEFDRAVNELLPGIDRVKQRLMRADKSVMEYKASRGISADEKLDHIPPTCYGGLFIVETCVHTIKEMSNYKWQQLSPIMVLRHNQPELPVDKDDHTCDCVRYTANDIQYKPMSDRQEVPKWGTYEFIMQHMTHTRNRKQKEYDLYAR